MPGGRDLASGGWGYPEVSRRKPGRCIEARTTKALHIRFDPVGPKEFLAISQVAV